MDYRGLLEYICGGADVAAAAAIMRDYAVTFADATVNQSPPILLPFGKRDNL